MLPSQKDLVFSFVLFKTNNLSTSVLVFRILNISLSANKVLNCPSAVVSFIQSICNKCLPKSALGTEKCRNKLCISYFEIAWKKTKTGDGLDNFGAKEARNWNNLCMMESILLFIFSIEKMWSYEKHEGQAGSLREEEDLSVFEEWERAHRDELKDYQTELCSLPWKRMGEKMDFIVKSITLILLVQVHCQGSPMYSHITTESFQSLREHIKMFSHEFQANERGNGIENIYQEVGEKRFKVRNQ